MCYLSELYICYVKCVKGNLYASDANSRDLKYNMNDSKGNTVYNLSTDFLICRVFSILGWGGRWGGHQNWTHIPLRKCAVAPLPELSLMETSLDV